MKIAVTSKGNTLEAPVDPRFGRCANFVIVESEDMSFKVVANDHASASGGAGIQAAQCVTDQDVQVVLTGNCGPNAFRALAAADVVVATGATGTVQEAVAAYQAGKLTATAGPNVSSHAGTTAEK